jgi:NAD(P)-dependent dehydrogenase (short-subunit alcohol dehydrogenase family)
MRFEDKVAVVTGAGSGIGKAIALAFPGEGAEVVVDYAGHPEPAQETIREIEDAGGRAVAVRVDVAQHKDVRALIRACVEEFGRLYILVNNAGIEDKMSFLETPPEIWEKAIAVELAPHGVTVNNIAPGAAETSMDAPLKEHPDQMQELLSEIPLGRMGKPEEIADLAVYLASDASAYVTGSTFLIDGGTSRQSGSL